MINYAIDKILNGENLDFTSAKEVFDEIFSGLSSPITSSSLISLLATKYETPEIIAAAAISANNAIKRINLPYNKESTVQNIVENNENYFDFSITNDIIGACAGLCAFDFSPLNPLFLKRKFKILSILGLNFKNEVLEFERENYVLKTISEDEPYFKYSSEIKMNLKFKTVLNMASLLLNPCEAKNLYLGINNKDDVEKMAKAALLAGYGNSIIVCGQDNSAYVTPFGETKIAEAWKNKIFTYDVSPKLLDMKEYQPDNIKIENNEHCAQLIKEISENKAPEAITESAILNAAMILYISKKADSLVSGIEAARKIIQENKFKEKLEQIKNFYS